MFATFLDAIEKASEEMKTLSTTFARLEEQRTDLTQAIAGELKEFNSLKRAVDKLERENETLLMRNHELKRKTRGRTTTGEPIEEEALEEFNSIEDFPLQDIPPDGTPDFLLHDAPTSPLATKTFFRESSTDDDEDNSQPSFASTISTGREKRSVRKRMSSPKKWRRMIRTHRLRSILME